MIGWKAIGLVALGGLTAVEFSDRHYRHSRRVEVLEHEQVNKSFLPTASKAIRVSATVESVDSLSSVPLGSERDPGGAMAGVPSGTPAAFVYMGNAWVECTTCAVVASVQEWQVY